MIAFEADAGGTKAVSCPVAAERLELVPGLVLRHTRVDAVPGCPGLRDWPGLPSPTD